MNLRNLNADFDARRLVAALTEADAVLADWPDGRGEILKGRDVLEGVAARKRPAANGLFLKVANKAQAKMVMAALQLIEQGEMDERAVHIFGRMLASVSDVGEARH